MVSLPHVSGAAETPSLNASLQSFVFLDYIRRVAMASRCKRKTDLFKACALLHADRDASCSAHADALMRCLDDALGRRARFYAVGTKEMTFDERWLISLGIALNAKDEASTHFLVKSQIKRHDQRLVRYLVARISEIFFDLE